MTAVPDRHPAELPLPLIEAAVRTALTEDLGQAGDVTSLATIAPEARAEAVFRAREDGVFCGADLAAASFRLIDPDLTFKPNAADGAQIAAGAVVGTVSGRARPLLSAERTALNFMCHLSGIAALTARFARETAGTKARICCTRKTTPGLRALEKHAVRCGGGSSHRYSLADAILIKDNHIAVCGGVLEALTAARAYAGHLSAIEIEVDTLAQLEAALREPPAAVLLDNMSPETLREAVRMTAGRTVLEASGGVRLETVRAIAETGVDFISSSRITMAASPLDIGLDIDVTLEAKA